MCIAFEGVRGTGGGLGLLEAGEEASLVDGDCPEEALYSAAIRPTASPLAVANGGGNGDIDKLDIDVE